MTPESSTPTSTDASRDDFVRRHLRRNVLALGADYVLYVIGLAFVSQATILPAFAAYLGAPNVAIGAIPAVATLGWLLPPLFAAGHTESLIAVYVPTNHLYLGDVVICRPENAFFPDLTVEEGIRVFLTGGMTLPPQMADKRSDNVTGRS